MKKIDRIFIGFLILIVLSLIISCHFFNNSSEIDTDNAGETIVDEPSVQDQGIQHITPMTYEERMGIEIQDADAGLDDDETKSIKKEIIIGTRKDIPDNLGMTKEQIIKEYIHGCFGIEDTAEALACFEDYYWNNDDVYINGIDECGGSAECLDRFYHDFAAAENNIFCNKIIDEEKKRECMTSII